MALLKIENLSKNFGALKAVSRVSFEVRKGQIFGIAGPNGSGKSTLFNIITGVPFSATSGAVWFDGHSISGMAPQKICHLGLARTFQRETAFDSLTAYQNIALGAVFGPGERDATGAATLVERVYQAAELVELDRAKLARKAAELSIFERKQLMLASALVMEPKAILLDEPASGLTKPEIAETIRIIRNINARGIAIVLIEHVLPVLLSLSKRLLVLNHGEMLRLGAPDDVVRDEQVIAAYLGKRGARDAEAA